MPPVTMTRPVSVAVPRPRTAAAPLLTRQGIPSVSDLRAFDRAHHWIYGVCLEHMYREAVVTTALAAFGGDLG